MNGFSSDLAIDSGYVLIWLVGPYEPLLSVNHAYRRGNPRYGKKARVEAWLLELKSQLMSLGLYKYPVFDEVQLDIMLYAPRQRGRRPDTSNFRKIPQDLIASVLGVDDSHFGGIDYPAVRNSNPHITFRLWWRLKDGKEPEI